MYLLNIHKDDLEFAVFERLKNFFSINVKLTFYDITSSFFYSDSCAISEKATAEIIGLKGNRLLSVW